MVNYLVCVILSESVIGQRCIGIEGRALPQRGFLRASAKRGFRRLGITTVRTFPCAPSMPRTAVLSTGPCPVIRRWCVARCIFRALPPMNVHPLPLLSHFPPSFTNEPDASQAECDAS
jgi:hypothetical protein